MKFLRLSWDDGAKLTEELIEKTVDYNPDILVGVSRGGLVPLRIFADVLDMKKIGVLGIQFYKAIGKTNKFPEITHDMPLDIKGKKILIIDDVADTGKSLVEAKKYIEKKGAKEIRTATLHYKPTSEIVPDYYIATTTDWIIYPWEVHEAERELKEIKK